MCTKSFKAIETNDRHFVEEKKERKKKKKKHFPTFVFYGYDCLPSKQWEKKQHPTTVCSSNNIRR